MVGSSTQYTAGPTHVRLRRIGSGKLGSKSLRSALSAARVWRALTAVSCVRHRVRHCVRHCVRTAGAAGGNVARCRESPPSPGRGHSSSISAGRGRGDSVWEQSRLEMDGARFCPPAVTYRRN